MNSFKNILERAVQRKGGEKPLQQLLSSPKTVAKLEMITADRYLSMMTKCINRAGFSWKVIDRKWPEFEQAFFGFKIETLLMLSDEQWEAYTQDRRVVRNWQKIKTVKDNTHFIHSLSINDDIDYENISALIAHWPPSDQIGLQNYLKKHGSRLGGQTCRYFLRAMGKDSFVLSRDVITTLISAGLDIKEQITSQREMKLIQQTFNQWHEESGLPFTHLSMIAAFSCGDNIVGVEINPHR